MWALTLPAALEPQGRLFIVDSTLGARELEITAEGDTAAQFTLNLAASIAGSVEPTRVLQSGTKVQISGVRSAPFGFTCLEVEPSAFATFARLRPPRKNSRAAATDVQPPSDPSQVPLGALETVARLGRWFLL